MKDINATTGESGDRAALGEVVLVAAVAANGVIGAGGGMPWHLPADLRHFKAVTMGHPMVMGRKTFEAIGRPLPGRRTIVVTRDPSWSHNGTETATSLTDALASARNRLSCDSPQGSPSGKSTVMIVGGGEIFAQAMRLATRLELTHIDAYPEGDTMFPEVDVNQWRDTARDERDGYTFVTYERRPQ